MSVFRIERNNSVHPCDLCRQLAQGGRRVYDNGRYGQAAARSDAHAHHDRHGHGNAHADTCSSRAPDR